MSLCGLALNWITGAAPYSDRCSVPHTKNLYARASRSWSVSFRPRRDPQFGQEVSSGRPISSAVSRIPWSEKQSEHNR